MRIRLQPPEEAAGITLGSTREEAWERCRALGDPEDFRRGPQGPPALVVHRPSGLAVFAYLDDDGRVEAVELGRPEHDDDQVTLDDLDVFGTPADDLVARLGQEHRVEVTEEGRSVTAPDLFLALWRPVLPEGPEDDEGRCFESVLVARPGYGD